MPNSNLVQFPKRLGCTEAVRLTLSSMLTPPTPAAPGAFTPNLSARSPTFSHEQRSLTDRVVSSEREAHAAALVRVTTLPWTDLARGRRKRDHKSMSENF
jgi:hypothetical protein